MGHITPLLRVRELSLTHPGAPSPTPHSVSFDLHAGEVVLLLGPSGSGKSTLALALNGLIPQALPTAMDGSVEIRGHSTADTPVATLSADVAMVFQDPDAQIVTGTVLDEVAFALENMRLPIDDILDRSERALRRVGLWDRRGDNPDRLSGGGRQRLAIACALAMGSPLIVLDEPTANLDTQGIAEVYDALENMAKSGDHAILLVEHNLDEAMRFATRVLVLDQQGRLAYDGDPADVLRTHIDELIQLGVWLPSAALAAHRLRHAGVDLDPLPLTPEDLVTALAARDDAELAHTSARTVENLTVESSAVIEVRDLYLSRGRQEILHGVSLEIPEGSLTAIVGPNGAGKTTLLQAIAGVLVPPRRRITVAGIDPGRASVRALSAHIGFVFQNPEHQFITGTVFDELAHGLRLRRAPAADIDQRVHEMLERFGLSAKAAVHPFLLSGGEKRRLSVGTALITRPAVLALDEPTFGQDRARASELLRLLADLHSEGTTILVVTHDLNLVAEHSTHSVVLANGRVHTVGRTADLLTEGRAFEDVGLRLPPLLKALPPAYRAPMRSVSR